MRFHRQFSYLWYDRLDRISERRLAQQEDIEQHAERIRRYALDPRITARRLLRGGHSKKKPTKIHLSILDKDIPE